MNSKKIFVVAIFALVGLSALVAQSKNRKEIDKFMKSYEEVVVQAEKAAKSNKMTDLLKVQAKALKMSDDLEKVQGFDEWTTKDYEKYLDLTNRYTKAMLSLSNSADSMDFGLGAFGF